MTKVLIIGATGSLGQALRNELSEQSEYEVTLFSRRSGSLILSSNERSMTGSATSLDDLKKALTGQDIVFVAVSGNLPEMASTITLAMKRVGVKRLIFVTSMGIYGEVDGEPQGVVSAILRPYRKAADIIEATGLDYTILRPGWFDNGSDTECQITQKGEIFYGHSISRRSIATLVKKMIDQQDLYIGENLGIYR